MTDGPRNAEDLLMTVERRLMLARTGKREAEKNGERLDANYRAGQIRELEVMDDLLRMVLNRPRTFAAS